MFNIFLILLSLSFIFGQFARLQFGNGVSLTLLDFTITLFSVTSFVTILLKARQKEVMSLKLFKPFAFFIIACLVSLLFNLTILDPKEAGIAGLYLLRFAIYASLLFSIPFISKQQKNLLIKALVISTAIAVGIGFFQFLYYPNLRNLYYLEWDDHLYRLFSVYLDPNFASVIFACLCFFLSGLAIEIIRKNRKKGFLLVILLLLSVLAVFLTYSRTGMIALIVGTVVLFLMKGYKKMLFLCFAIFAVLLFLTADVMVEGLNPFRTVSTNARLESTRIALAIFEKNPLIGVGFNAYRYAQHRYGFRPDDRWQTSHADAGTDNSFLFVLATTGVTGFVFYLYFWYTFLRTAFVNARKGKGTSASVVFATSVAVLISSLFLNTLFYPFIMVWIFIIYAVTERKSP